MMPSATDQTQGDLSLVVTHESQLLPSKRIVASEGGAYAAAPGVTIAGSGDQISVSSGLVVGAAGFAGVCWAARTGTMARKATSGNDIENLEIAM